MKRLKKTLALLTAALFCVLPLFTQTLTAEAEEPITYYLKYLEADGVWRYQQLTAWDENDNNGPLDYVIAAVKDGDTIVIDGNESINLELNSRLANLTILNANTVIISTKSIDEYYQHDGITVLNADVKNAYVYDASVCNFNKNVDKLNIIGANDINASVGVNGTVGYVKGSDNFKVYYEGYNFAKDTLRIQDGSLRTEAKHYSTTAPSTPSAGSSASNNNDYDAVPKTGESNLMLCLVVAAAMCACGSYRLRRN